MPDTKACFLLAMGLDQIASSHRAHADYIRASKQFYLFNGWPIEAAPLIYAYRLLAAFGMSAFPGDGFTLMLLSGILSRPPSPL